MMEAADEVLSRTEVRAGLAADRGVDLGEQGGGNLHVVDAAHVDGGEKAGHIAEDAAAEGEEQGTAIGTGFGELDGKLFDAGEALVLFPGGHEEDSGSVLFREA